MTPLVLQRTPTEIFPAIDIPVISVAWNYSGFSPQQMDDYIVSSDERFMTTVVDNIEHIESQTVAGRSIIKVFFQPGADIRLAMSQLTSSSQTLIRQMPPGRASPLLITYSASTVPIVDLALKGEGFSEQELFDYGANFVRNQLTTIPGAAIPWPYRRKAARKCRSTWTFRRCRPKGMSPVDVINAISSQNLRCRRAR